MIMNHIRKKWKKVRALYQEYTDLRSETETIQVEETRIRDEAEVFSEKRNVRLVRALLREEIGGEPESFPVRRFEEIRRRRDHKFKKARRLAPFLQIEEEEYVSNTHEYYVPRAEFEGKWGRHSTDLKNESNLYCLHSRFRRGWRYLPPLCKPLLDPELQSRRAEIRQRIVQLSGMGWWAAVRTALEIPESKSVGRIDRRPQIQESIHRREMEVERRFLQTSEEDQRRSKRGRTGSQGEHSRATAEEIDKYRCRSASVTIEEKLST